jgi:hypothetical protein
MGIPALSNLSLVYWGILINLIVDCFINLPFFFLRLRWWIFVTKILLLLRSHLVTILIISGLSRFLFIRIPHATCFCNCFHSSSKHRIEYLYHVWRLRIVSWSDDLSVVLLLAILWSIKGVRDCSDHWWVNLGGKSPKNIWKHPFVKESKWLARF